MLNTFENAERQFLRQMERERHFQTIETVLHGDDDGLVRHHRLDQPFQADSPSLRKVLCPKRRIFVLLTAVVVIAVACLVTVNNPVKGDVADAKPVVGNEVNARYENLFSLVLDWNVTSRQSLEDVKSPQRLALNWLAFDDAAEKTDNVKIRFALATIYFSTVGASSTWKIDSDWLSSRPVCFWYGVGCRPNGVTLEEVQSLNLSANGLRGTLPDEVSLLGQSLLEIDLSANDIFGNIPDLGELKNLASLYLGPNSFSSTLPPSLYALSKLTQVYLNDCRLKGPISSDIKSLSSLQGLDVHNNFLSGSIPAELGYLTDLRALYLDGNRFTGTIPETVGNLTQVVDFRLGDNSLVGPLPSTLSNLGIVQVLYVGNNVLSGTIPLELFDSFPLIRELQLQGNRITGPLKLQPDAWPLLRLLYADGNVLTGEVPSVVTGFLYLQSLLLSDNKFVGTISTSFGRLQSLEFLLLDGNSLSGPIPTELGLLTDLQVLSLQKNSFKGQVPTELQNLISLNELNLQMNDLTGSLPLSLCSRIDGKAVEIRSDCLSSVSCDCCSQCY